MSWSSRHLTAKNTRPDERHTNWHPRWRCHFLFGSNINNPVDHNGGRGTGRTIRIVSGFSFVSRQWGRIRNRGSSLHNTANQRGYVGLDDAEFSKDAGVGFGIGQGDWAVYFGWCGLARRQGEKTPRIPKSSEASQGKISHRRHHANATGTIIEKYRRRYF